MISFETNIELNGSCFWLEAVVLFHLRIRRHHRVVDNLPGATVLKFNTSDPTTALLPYFALGQTKVFNLSTIAFPWRTALTLHYLTILH